MRSLKLVLLALILSAPALSATTASPAEALAEPSAELAPTTVVEAAPEADEAAMHLDRIEVEQRSAVTDDAAATQFAQRGSFWWIVGVIVVAGVILAVLL